MKIKFDIQDKFKELELHVCCDGKTKKSEDLYNLLQGIFLEKITVCKNYETMTVSLHEIVRIYSASKKIYLRTAEETFEVKERLYVLEERLQNFGFVRISNTEIVNTAQIAKLDLSYTGTIKMIMKNKDTTFVSRRYVSRIREVLK